MESIVKQDIVVEKCLLLSANPRSKMSHTLSIVLQGLTLSVFTIILLALGFKRISFLSWLHFIIKWLNAFSRWHGIFHVYLFIYLFNHYLYTVKKKKRIHQVQKIPKTSEELKIIILTLYELTPICHLKTWFPWMQCLKIMIEKVFKLV